MDTPEKSNERRATGSAEKSMRIEGSFGTDEQFKVAVVDFQAPGAAKKFTDSLKTTGFAVLTNHPVSTDLIEGVYSEWREFLSLLHQHALSGDESAETNLSKKYFRRLAMQDGYFPMASAEKAKGASVQDLKHYFQCYFPNGQFPTEEVSDSAERLWAELIALGKTLVNWIDDYMPPDIRATIEEKIGKGVTLSDCVSDDRTMMRILHYPGYSQGDQAVGAVRAAAHEDINLITVLPAGSARGLQVKSNQSGDWYEVPLVEGSIVINIGDMMQEMSEGAYISTTHRVIKMDEPTDESTSGGASGDFLSGDRMSTPCFIHLKKKCPMSSRFGSAEHYLLDRLVTLGVMPSDVLNQFLIEHEGGVIPGWDSTTE